MSMNQSVRNQDFSETYNGVLDASVQEQEIWQRLLNLARDQRFVMNYWLKVCKLRAVRGLPMPWDAIH